MIKRPALSKGLPLAQSFTISTTGQYKHVSDDVVVFRSGNCLIYYSISQRKQSILTLDSHLILDAFAVDSSSHTLACAVHRLEHQILLFRFPNPEPYHIISSDTLFPISHLALSANASWVASISSRVDRKLTVWDVQSSTVVISVDLEDNGNFE